jgi:hypothetical protein
MLFIFFDIKGIVHKEFILAGQTVNSTYCCDVLQWLHDNMRRLCPELWQQNWLLHHDNAPSHTSFLTRNNMTIVPHPPYFSRVSPIQDKTERLKFGDNWGDQAESQAVLNTTTEPDFQDAFKRMAESLGTVHTHVEGWLRGWWWPVSPKLVFDQVTASVPEIMDDSLYVRTGRWMICVTKYVEPFSVLAGSHWGGGGCVYTWPFPFCMHPPPFLHTALIFLAWVSWLRIHPRGI